MLWMQTLSHKNCVSIARAFQESDGQGLILCHPFDFGIPGPDGIALEGEHPFLEQYNQYLTRLKASLTQFHSNDRLRNAVGILFEAVCDREVDASGLSSWQLMMKDRKRINERLRTLKKWDHPSRQWLVVPTNFSNATPFIQSWQNLLNALKELGLRKALVGGCYQATLGGRPVPATVAYSCVAHLAQELYEDDRFEEVRLVRQLVCAVEVSPF